jgi:hypothetical protein
MRRLVSRHPFLLFGLLTFGLFLAIETTGDAFPETALGAALISALRVLIVPLWLMRTLEMVVGIGWWPGPLQLVVALPLLFLPYVLADLLLARLRRRGAHPAHPDPAV